MRQYLHSWGWYGGLLWLLGWLPALGWAQCPVAARCTPGKASNPLAASYGMGIYSVTLGSITNSTGGYADGYRDYSCTIGTALTVSAATNIYVSTMPATGGVSTGAQNVRVWIDYNNDGTFATSELAFSSDYKLMHAGTITPPATATLGTRLRMRVAADAADSPIPTPCSTPQYSQTEDYAVTLVANSIAPTAAFGTDATTTCSGCVQLTDQSTGGPTSWRWDFGDNTSSTEQNPRHCYAAAGAYQVRLTATNAAGSSISAATAITYNTNVPVAASCPGLAATAYCCNYGITRVLLDSLDNPSADGSAGYQDFTCTQRVRLAAGVTYTLNIGTGGNRHDVRAWLDANNDGVFADTEKIYEGLNAAAAVGLFTVPATAMQGKPLRLRIVADGVGTNPRPCVAPTLGQVEDYSVTVTPNTHAPVAAFTSNYVAGMCTAPINSYTFTDKSTFAPTSWQWSFSPSADVSFVNGTSATSQNPQVAFAAAGTYSVTLTASNANGSNTFTASNYLVVQVPCLTYCASNGGYAGGAASSLWISDVVLPIGPLSNPSGNSVGGYSFYSGPRVILRPNATHTFTVTTNLAVAHRTVVWIDYNRDGVFANTFGSGGERLYDGVSNPGQATTTFLVTAPAVVALTRMRVLVTLGAGTNACATNFGEGEVEDYLVSTVVLGTSPAQALPALTVSPNPTPDGAVQLHVAEASANGRYTVEVQSVLGAQLLRQQVQLRAGQPTPLSLATLPAGLYLVRLTSERGEVAVRRVLRQ